MSDKIFDTYNERSAVKFNANFARNPPREVILAVVASGDSVLADLAGPPSSPAFARAVAAFQRLAFKREIDVDGKLGPKTAEALAKMFAPKSTAAGVFVHNGARLLLPRCRAAGVEIVSLDDGEFDITRGGAFYNRGPRRQIKRIVIHWGGKNLPHLSGFYQAEPSRSAHFGVDAFSGGGRVGQLLDTGVDAWHSGRAGNTDTIGIDLCQFADVARGRKAYPDLGTKPNVEAREASRGFNEIMILDNRIASAARALVFDLLDAFGLEAIPPLDSSGRLTHKWGDAVNVVWPSSRLATVVGHHHLARQKSDVIGWWRDLFYDTPLAP